MLFSILNRKWWREQFFPVEKGEYLKFFVLAVLCFLACANYTLLRTVKETLVITQPEMGAQVVPFLRTWMMIPLMLLFVKVYATLSARYIQSTVCYAMLLTFLLFFIVFTYVLYPHEADFRLEKLGSWISSFPIPFAKQIGVLIRYWSFSIYYCLAEVWGSIVVSILFWGASNRESSSLQAKRFYSPILLIANLSGLFASEISLFFSHSPVKFMLFPNLNEWGATLSSITLFVCFTTAIIIGLFAVLFHYVGASKEKEQPLPSKQEMSIWQMVNHAFKDSRLFVLTLMVFAYFFVSGVMEIVWKFYAREVYPNSNAFNDYLSNCTKLISIISTLLALNTTGAFIRRFSWRINALITPMVLIIPVVILALHSSFYGVSAEMMVIFGGVYFCLNRICKFTFFDLSKEVSIVALPYGDQIKSKAIIDGCIPKIGKASESIFLQVLLVGVGSFEMITLPVLFTVLFVHLFWIRVIPRKKNESIPVPA